MEIYEALGYGDVVVRAVSEARTRPTVGTQIVGSESNAVSFFNSVLGARTNKYDLLDVCAIIGKVPLAGLHTDEGRLATRLRLDYRRRTGRPVAPPSARVIMGAPSTPRFRSSPVCRA